MNNDRLLTIVSLLAIALFSVHLADDIARGFEPGSLRQMQGIAIMAAWACATLLLMGRRVGYVLVLLGSLLASVVPYAHLRGAGVTHVAATAGGHLFVWTLLAVGVCGMLGVVLCVRGLWGLRRAAAE